MQHHIKADSNWDDARQLTSNLVPEQSKQKKIHDSLEEEECLSVSFL